MLTRLDDLHDNFSFCKIINIHVLTGGNEVADIKDKCTANAVHFCHEKDIHLSMS